MPETYADDRLRRIHWWVRLFGVVWVISLLFGAAALFGLALISSNNADACSSYSYSC